MLALVFKFRFSFELTACQKNTDKAKVIAVMLPASLSWTDLTAVKILHRQDQMHLFFICGKCTCIYSITLRFEGFLAAQP